jgi:hypothetical protein
VRELLIPCGAECVSAHVATASRLCPAAATFDMCFIFCLVCQQLSVLSVKLYLQHRRSGCLEAQRKSREYGDFRILHEEAPSVSLIAVLLSYLVSTSAVVSCVLGPSVSTLLKVVRVS